MSASRLIGISPWCSSSVSTCTCVMLMPAAQDVLRRGAPELPERSPELGETRHDGVGGHGPGYGLEIALRVTFGAGGGRSATPREWFA